MERVAAEGHIPYDQPDMPLVLVEVGRYYVYKLDWMREGFGCRACGEARESKHLGGFLRWVAEHEEAKHADDEPATGLTLRGELS